MSLRDVFSSRMSLDRYMALRVEAFCRAGVLHRNSRAPEAPGGAAPSPIQRPWRSLGTHSGHRASPRAQQGGTGGWRLGSRPRESSVLGSNANSETEKSRVTGGPKHVAHGLGSLSVVQLWPGKRPMWVVAQRARRRPLPPPSCPPHVAAEAVRTGPRSSPLGS